MTHSGLIAVYPWINLKVLSSICISATTVRIIFIDSICDDCEHFIISTIDNAINGAAQLIEMPRGRCKNSKKTITKYFSGSTTYSITQFYSLTKRGDFYEAVTATTNIVSVNCNDAYCSSGQSSLRWIRRNYIMRLLSSWLANV